MSAPITIRGSDGASFSVHPLGAQVSSWVPAGRGEQFFTARNAPVGEKAFKGGVPVCFPQFADTGPLMMHGFARDVAWAPAGEGRDARGAWAAFRLTSAAAAQSSWPHAFALELTAAALGGALTVSLEVKNTGPRPWYFTGALHTYFAVSDIAEVTLEGLAGRSYLDKTRGHAPTVQQDPLLRVSEETDRVYLGAQGPLVLRDRGHAVEIRNEGFPDVVVWNPWQGAETRFPQFGPGDYRRMICVEAAVAREPVTMQPGASWTGSQRLRVQ